MDIAAWQPISLLDYPDRMAVTLFTPGCTMRCPFCHNPDLVLPERAGAVKTFDETEVLDRIRQRAGFVDGVVITGGEPTLQPDLADFIGEIKQLGLLIKLDTNGTRPEIIESLLEAKLIDYVAMDIKAPRSRYAEFAGCAVDLDAIDRSMSLLRDAAIQTEFRTTVAPGLATDDLRAIAQWLDGSDAYWLQTFRVPPDGTLVDPAWAGREAMNAEALHTLWSEIAVHFRTGGVRE